MAEEQRKEKKWPAVVFLIIVVGIIYYCNQDTGTKKRALNWTETENKMDAYFAVEMTVKKRLKSPSSADFCGYHSAKISYDGNRTYTVAGYVDAQNSFGAAMRTSFVGQVKQVSEYNWKLISLIF